jgi:RNA polymerase sigma-70 factor (ECF subfamily)
MDNSIDAEVEALVKSGQMEKAATRALEVFGSEIYGFLVSFMDDDTAASDVFSQAGEDLWTGLPKFQFKSSLRTWLYVLARNAASRYRRSPWNKRDRRQNESRIESIVEIARSRTQPWQRTDVKDAFNALRQSLDPDDRILLTLRIDRSLAWKEVARVMLDSEGEIDPATLSREVDRVRKRFQLLKDELRKRAQDAGLLDVAR